MRFRTLLLPVAVLGLLAACGDNAVTSGSAGPSSTLAGAVPKPDVKLPSATPTSLVVTDLTEGTGEAAAKGDTIIVYYVGVRSADGKEFDNSYDRGTPLPVTLGAGEVIAGWDQGLVGIKSGGRRQLDIPTDLAYGDAPPPTDVIQPGDALSFVIDAVTIIHKPDPTDAPDISIPPTPNQDKETFTDLIVGQGAGIQPGQTVAVQLLAFSAADGKLLDSSWDEGRPLSFVPGAGLLPPGVEKAVEGMKVGGRRQIDIPFAEAWGAGGQSDLGLPPSTDLILVLDLVAVY
jgi:peptidylprolyl isomerase